MSEFIGSYENQVLDAIDIVVQAAIQSAGYDRTISATIMECIDSERGLYKVKYQDAIYTASAEDPSKKYTQNSQVYVLIPENDYSKHKRIIGTASELGEDYAATITENPYKILGGNCALMAEELSFSSYKGIDEYILYSSKGNVTNSISIDKETFLSYVKDASRIKIGMDFKTFILKAQEGGVYGLQIIFTEKNIENQNEPLRKLVSLTNFDMIGHPYCSLDWGFQSIEFEINPERFIEIEEIKFFLQGFKEDKDKEEIPDIYIKDFFLAGLAHQDSTALNTYYLDIITPANRTFTEGKDTLEMTADLSFRGETVVSTPPVEYYWFRENATVKVESIPVDQKPLYHVYAGEGWECLNPYTFVTEEVEVNGVKETKITGGNWGSLTTYSITSQNLKKVRYRCIAYFKDKVVGVKDIEITNNNPKYDLELISSDGNFNFYDNLGSKKLTLKLNKVAEENKNFEVEWGTLDSSKLYNAIETIKVEDNQSSLTIYGRDINIEKRYFATLFKVEEEKKELIGTISANVTNEILSKESTYSVRIKNGEQVFIYDEGGYAPNHSSKTSPQVIIPLEFSLFDPDGKEIEVGEDFEIGVQWRLPQEGTLLTDTGSDSTALTYSFGIASTYSKDKTNNTIVLEVLYKDKICKDYTNFTFLKDGNSGTNGTGAFGKISFATDLNGEYPLLLQTSNNEFILNGNNINTNNSQLAVSIWNNGIETPSEKIKKITWRLNTVGGDETKHQSYYTVDTGAIALIGNDFTYLSNENIEKDHYIFSIVQAEIEYEDTASTRRKLFTEMPICLARSYSEGYSIRMKKGSGFNEVLYINDGTSPQYASNPFEVEVLYNGTIFSDTKLSYKWRADGVKKNLIKLTNKNSNIESHLVDSLTRYDGLSLDLGITVIAYLEEEPIATLFFPINFLINRYGYAALNDWDGHSIQINEEDGYILTPQVGVGSKDTDNSFTGVLIGEVKGSKTESGLFGYNKGQRTIFLDAETGKAEFGSKTGVGQIIIDPEDEKNAYIRSGNYSTTAKTGMEINLTKPYIKFGSGDFEVNAKGEIKSTAGSIGGWYIEDNYLYSLYTDSNNKKHYTRIANYSREYPILIGGDSLTSTSEAKFMVDRLGTLTATAANITGAITATSLTLGDITNTDEDLKNKGFVIQGTKIGNGSTPGDTGTGTGTSFKVSTNGLLEANNAVIKGTIYAGAGLIGGWTIGTHRLYSNSTNQYTRIQDSTLTYAIVVGASSETSDGGDAPFGVKHDGSFHATKATISGTLTAGSGSKIGPWNVSNTAIYKGDSSYPTSTSGNIYIGENGISLGANFKVSSAGVMTATSGSFTGTLTATSGTIGGWHIGTNRLYSCSNSDGIDSSTRLVCLYNYNYNDEHRAIGVWARSSTSDVWSASNHLKFYVKYNGEMYANKATIEGDSTFGGKLSAVSGTFTSLTAGQSYFSKKYVKIDAGDSDTSVSSIRIGEPSTDDQEAGWEDISIIPYSKNKGNVGTEYKYFNIVRASSISGPGSLRSIKKNIQKYDINQAYLGLKELPFYTYNYITDEYEQQCKLGTILDFMPSETLVESNASSRNFDFNNTIFWGLAAAQAIQQKLEETIEEKNELQNRLDILEQKFLEMEEKLNGFN